MGDISTVTQATSIPGAITSPEIGAYFEQQEADERSRGNPATEERRDNQVAPAAPAAATAPDPAKEADERKSLDAILDRWEKGHPDEAAAGNTDPLKGTPFEGLSVDHPVVKWAANQANQQNWNTQATEFARALYSSGVPQQLIPDLIQFVAQARQLASRNTELEGLLSKVDKSDMVITTMANRTAAKYKAYGVEPEDLIRAHPESAKDMDNLAKTIAIHNRRNAVASRASSGADRFESTGHGSPANDIMDMKKPGLDILRRAFA